MDQSKEIEFMRIAIKESRKSVSEDDQPHPLVGAVVVVGDSVLRSAHRCQTGPGDHAEEGVLEKLLHDAPLHGATVYTTLEPCTKRSRLPCAELLTDRKVSRVVIGMLDPDQRITGKGILHLRRHGVAVDLFPPEMMAEVEELNRKFTRVKEQESSRLLTTGPFRSRAELPKMEAWPEAQSARDILMIGHNLHMIFRQKEFFKKKLAQGCRLRLLIANPADDTLLTIMSRGVVETNYTRGDFKPVIDTIRELRDALSKENKALIQLKTMNYVPSLSFQLIDGEFNWGSIIVELVPNKMEVLARPSVLLHASEPTHKEWYQKFFKNCTDMYAVGKEYQWD